MGINTFSPREAGVPRHIDLEHQMVHSDVISQADITKYADYIIDNLKLLKSKSDQEKQTFVVDALSEDKILRQVEVVEAKLAGHLDHEEAQSALRQVRKALVERLKGKLDENIYLNITDLVNRTEDRVNIISKVVGVASGKEEIYKDQELLIKEHKDDTAEAIALFKKLAPHPNIVNIKEYDEISQRTIYEKLNLQPLHENLKVRPRNRQKFVVSLKVVKDCLVGAQYLADNGLVLQDIKLSNLGLVTDEETTKGVLFDLEGLLKEGTKMSTRMYGGIMYLPPEILENKEEGIKPSEMVYQFGNCLEEILDYYEKEKIFKSADEKISESADGVTAKKLDALAEKMREQNPEKRPSLSEAKNELEEIIGKL